ncbi:acyltransferase family protein [Limosilactobacillus mucosae]
MSKQNYALDFLKLFFIVVVIIHHSHIIESHLVKGYLSVEFFFFVSGYFLCNGLKKKRSTKDNLKRKLVNLYPAYFVAFVVICIVEKLLHVLSFETWYAPILELLMMLVSRAIKNCTEMAI